MLRAENITKMYGSVTAVKNLSMEIRRGEIFALLGPNGAGKTTTIKMFTALTRPDTGRCLVNGHVVSLEPEKIKPLIGVVPQVNNLDRDLTAFENLTVYAMLHRVKRAKARITEALKMVDLYERRDHAVSGFSGGMQRRLLLARAMLPEPEILFLDEPSIGLDPQIRRSMWDTIRRTRYQGRTVVITTHYIEEAEALCDRVGVMRKGELIALGTPDELKASVGKYVVEYTGAEGRLMQEIKSTKDEAYQEAKRHNNGSVSIRKSNLEDVFINLTGERIE